MKETEKTIKLEHKTKNVRPCDEIKKYSCLKRKGSGNKTRIKTAV